MSIQARIEALVDESVARDEAPGIAAGVLMRGERYVAAAGSLGTDGRPVGRDSLFRISSMTKPITAAAVLALVEENTLALDEPIDRLLPELADRQVLREPSGSITDTVPATRAITTRDLLTFTWGFGQQGALFGGAPWPIVNAAAERNLETFGPPNPAAMPDADTWIARLGELPLMTQPGERWLYHSGFQVLGVLAARAVGATLLDVLRERVLDPLGMSDTAFHTTDTNRLATSYLRHDGELQVYDAADGQWSVPPQFQDGGAGLVSSIDDMLTFGSALLHGGAPILSTRTVADMTRNHLTDEQRTRVWPGFDILDGAGWGFGVAAYADGSYGWDGGLGTRWISFPDIDATVVVLSQRGFDETGYAGAGVIDLVRSWRSSR